MQWKATEVLSRWQERDVTVISGLCLELMWSHSLDRNPGQGLGMGRDHGPYFGYVDFEEPCEKYC